MKKVLLSIFGSVLILGSVGVCAAGSAVDGKPFQNSDVTTWFDSDIMAIKGAAGENGKDGKDGAPGRDGKDGINGVDGKDGTNGKDGADGVTPHIGDNGNWYIGETDTGIKAEGTDGADGQDGINGVDGKDGANGQDGADGVTPHIGDNGNWYIGETDTGVKAEGTDGANGRDGVVNGYTFALDGLNSTQESVEIPYSMLNDFCEITHYGFSDRKAETVIYELKLNTPVYKGTVAIQEILDAPKYDIEGNCELGTSEEFLTYYGAKNWNRKVVASGVLRVTLPVFDGVAFVTSASFNKTAIVLHLTRIATFANGL